MVNGENKRCHLPMIQQNIDSMRDKCFHLKELSVVVFVGAFIFVEKSSNVNTIKAVIVSTIPLLLFWILDGYYLMLERQFRELFNNVRKKKEEEIDFDMSLEDINIPIIDAKKCCLFNCIFSKSVWPFYLILILISIILYLF